jgi:hypothetical protein
MKAKSRYEIQDVVARGGMGVANRAQDRVLDRLIALETIHDLSDPARSACSCASGRIRRLPAIPTS